MRPVLFEFGPITVQTYGVMMAAAGLAAWLVVRHELVPAQRPRRGGGRGRASGAAILLVTRWQRLPFSSVRAAAAVALPLAYGLGRIGCQLAGDGTYGVASDLPWAMSYPNGEVPTTAPVHPTPVYETLASLLIFAALWRLRDRLAPERLFGPQLFAAAFVSLDVVLLLAGRARLRSAPLAGGLS